MTFSCLLAYVKCFSEPFEHKKWRWKALNSYLHWCQHESLCSSVYDMMKSEQSKRNIFTICLRVGKVKGTSSSSAFWSTNSDRKLWEFIQFTSKQDCVSWISKNKLFYLRTLVFSNESNFMTSFNRAKAQDRVVRKSPRGWHIMTTTKTTMMRLTWLVRYFKSDKDDKRTFNVGRRGNLLGHAT